MTEPATASGRPPYYVWLGMRLLGILGTLMVIGGLLHAISNAIHGDYLWLPLLFFVVGGWISDGGVNWTHPDGDTSPFCENLGWRLASKGCPQCGQSVFNRMPPRGFELESARHSYWPSRICYGCGSDTTRRRASIPSPPSD